MPPAVTSAGQEAIELAESVGLVLDPWQRDVLDGSLGERDDGRWASLEVGVIVPRQNGKGGLIEARELAGLFLFGEQLITHTAHEFKTALEGFRRVLALIEGSDDLRRRVKRVVTSHGEEGVELVSGQRLRFAARSTGSGRGFTGDTIFFDEAYRLPATAISAMFSTLAARPNPQIWYTSSAPLPIVESDTLRGLCRQGRAGVDRLAYFEWAAADRIEDVEVEDPGLVPLANPAFGIRITAEFAEAELRRLGPEDYARERLGIWPDVDDGSARVISEGDWLACESSGEATDPVAVAFDVSPDRSTATVAAAGASSVEGHRVHLEVVKHAAGTGWVVPFLVRLVEARSPIAVVCDPAGPAGGLLAAAAAAGVEVQVVSAREHTQACGGLYDGVIERDVCHIGQVPLDAAVAGAEKRDVGDAWLWSRKSSTVDISPLVAVTLAKWAWENAPVPEATASVW